MVRSITQCLRDAPRRLARGLPQLLCGLVALSSVACGVPEEEPVLRLATNTWPGYEPFYLAREKGLLGPAVRLQELPSATAVLDALRLGQSDAAAVTLDEALLLAADGMPVQLILVTNLSHGGDALVARPEVRGMAGLKGRKVGVENTALGAYMLQRALDHGGISAADILPVSLTVDRHLAAYEAGEVDAVVTFEPQRTKLLLAGARVLFDSTSIPGEIADVVVVRRDFLQENPRLVQHLLEGWFAALDLLAREPADSLEIMGRRMQMSGPEVAASLQLLEIPTREENQRLVAGDSPELLAAARRLQETMLARRLLGTPVKLERLFASGSGGGP